MAFFGLFYYVLQSFTRNRPNFKIPRSSSMRTPSPPGIGSPMHNKPLGVSSTPGSFQVNKQGKNRKNNSLIAYSSPRHSVWKLLKKVQIILQYCLFTFMFTMSAVCLHLCQQCQLIVYQMLPRFHFGHFWREISNILNIEIFELWKQKYCH